MNDQFSVSKKLVITNTVGSLVVRVVSTGLMIWVQQFFLKYISLEEYSILPVAMSLMVFFPLLSAVFTVGIKRYVMIAFVQKDEQRISEIVSSMFPVLCAISALWLFIGYIFSTYINQIIVVDEKYLETAQFIIQLLFVSEAMSIVCEAFNSGLYVKQKFILENTVMLASEVLRFALMFIILFGFFISIKAVVISTVVASVFKTAVTLFLSLKHLPQQKFRFKNIKLSTIKELSNFGGWGALHGFAGMIRKTSDAFLLNRFATPLDVTYFHLGSLLPNRIEVMINQSFLGSVSPAVVGLAAQNQMAKLHDVYLKLGRYALWGVLSIWPPFIVFNQAIVKNYVGDAYSSAGTVLVLLLLCFPIYYGNLLYKTLATAMNRMRSMALRELTSTALNLSLTIVLVRYYDMGAIGAAIATLVVFGFGGIFIYWPLGKELSGVTKKEIFKDIIFPGLSPFLLTVLFLSIISRFFEIEEWIDIIIAASCGAVVYLLALCAVANQSDLAVGKSTLLKLWKKVIR